MKNVLFTPLLVLLLCTCGRAQQNTSYEVTVHPGQELVTIIQVLAERYSNTNPSNYQADMLAHFGPHKDHPAVKALAKMSERVYSDFPELGWCLTSFPEPDLFLPETNSWYELYGKDTVQQVIRLARDFAAASDFWTFYQAHQPAYRAWAKDVEHTLDSLGHVEKLASFYDKGTYDFQPKFFIALDPLNGWGAHAIPHLEEINPYYKGAKGYSLGYWNRESTTSDSPSFSGDDFLSDLVWHEGSHVYLTPIVEAHEALIESISYLYNGDERKMKRQNIDTWAYCFEENLVRGVVIALSKQHRTNRRYREQKADELLSGFLYAEDIAEWLGVNYLTEKNDRSLSDLLPELVKWLGDRYDGVPK